MCTGAGLFPGSRHVLACLSNGGFVSLGDRFLQLPFSLCLLMAFEKCHLLTSVRSLAGKPPKYLCSDCQVPPETAH